MFTPNEFFHYLVGLCAAGRSPEVHIYSSVHDENAFSLVFDYDVLIEFNN